MSLTMIDYRCEHCKGPFQRRRGKRHRFCSRECVIAGCRRITAEMLAPYAQRGTPQHQVAAELNFSRSAFAIAMRRYGLYQLWCQRRYTKCAPSMIHVEQTS